MRGCWLPSWIAQIWGKILCSAHCFSSVQFSRSVVSDSLQPHGLQHARLPCPSPTPEAYSNSCSLRQSCHPTISSSVVPFSSCLQSSPASGSFPMSQLFTWGGQSIGVSFQRTPRADLLQNGLVGFPCSPRVFSNTTVQKHQFFGAQLCSQSNSHIHTWPLEKPQPWLDGPLLQSVESQSWTQLSD